MHLVFEMPKMQSLFLIALSVLLSLVVGAPSWGHAPLAYTQQGFYQGKHNIDGVEAFLGIPYAQPPVGTLRFQPPQALNDPTCNGDENAPFKSTIAFGPVCHQVHYASVLDTVNLRETTPQSEDCLTLNVWRPAGTKKEDKLPVMIWIYGGAFSEGGGSVPIYNPQHFVQQNPSVIVVTFNYRLGIFGFPHSFSSRAKGNLGLLDQRLAIEWTRENIDGFGGDPSRMILFGESAGAVSISAYSFTYKSDPIVKGFILQSGVALGIGDADEEQWGHVAGNVGCADAENPGSDKEIDCMMALPGEKIMKAVSNMTVNPFGSTNGGSPFVDNKTVWGMEEYASKVQAGDFARLPVLMGSNDDEGEGVVNFSPETGMNETLAEDITISHFTCPIGQLASQLHSHEVPVWRYRYMPVWPTVTFYPFVETYHLSDVPVVLGSFHHLVPHKTPTDNEVEASKLLQRAWVSFAHDPEQGIEKEMGWPMYNPDEPTLIQLFQKNSLSIDFVDPKMYEQECTNPPVVSWEDIAAPPPESG